MRADRAYWARLRKDARSNWSAGLATLAAFSAIVTVMVHIFTGAPATNRFDPLYWLMLAPFAWWGASLASFERWAVRLMLPIAVLSPPICAGALLLSDSEATLLSGIAFIISLSATSGAILLYRGSLLRAEGPSR